MYSVYQRFNNLSALLSSCLLGLLAAIALSSLVFTADPKGTLDVGPIRVYPAENAHFRRRNSEFAFVRFDLKADLTPLFHWNTKQLFLYLQAEYTSPDGTRNEVVIWDRIVRRKEDAKLNVSGKNKYSFRELGKTFKNASPANYTLKYNLMPHVGLLTYGEAARTIQSVAFPPAKSSIA